MTPRPAVRLARLSLALSCVAVGVAVANAVREPGAAEILPPTGGAACPVAVVDYTFLSYDGPVGVTGACVASFQYTGARMTIVAYDATQDGVFRNGFDQPAGEG